jgi:hypothetical protein
MGIFHGLYGDPEYDPIDWDDPEWGGRVHKSHTGSHLGEHQDTREDEV